MQIDFLLTDWLPAIIDWDKQMLTRINTDWGNSFFDIIAPHWRSRKIWLPIYAIISVMVLYRYKKSGIYVLGFIGITMVVANLISSELIKELVQRVRPCNDDTVIMRDIMECSPKSSFSFTSSHATNHFALSFIMIYLIPFFRTNTWRFVLIFWAATIAYAQVYVGRHFLIDVSVGAILGITIASLMSWLYSFLQKKFIVPPTM
jgi:membrane-associated phospholipid phosphatase